MMALSDRRSYLAIDLKSYFASCECADRHLDPLRTNLVVADESRTEKTICLAVSPSLKAHGIPGRARLFEVIQRVEQVNAMRLAQLRRVTHNPHAEFTGESFDAEALEADPYLKLSYVVAPPRMARYMETSAKVYQVYLKYVAPEDIYSYSIDEVFIDATAYLNTYGMTAHELCMAMIRDVLYTTGITATGGIGTNLYLAKVAMDIMAKHVPADQDGVRIAELNEYSYRARLWDHTPLTDFWRCGAATARKLEKRFLHTMGDVAQESLRNPEWFYQTFGIDAEILIDHAWGFEPVTMAHIKNYKNDSHSISEGQVLSEPYAYDKARIIVREMADNIVMRLVDEHLVTELLTLDIGYDRENCDPNPVNQSSQGQKLTPQTEVRIDRYGRLVPHPAHGSTRLGSPTNLGSVIIEAVVSLFERIANPAFTVRRITIAACNVTEDTGAYQMDLFTDVEKQEKEKRLQEAMLSIKKRYGKNAVLKGTNFEEGATGRERNKSIGGHRAGDA